MAFIRDTDRTMLEQRFKDELRDEVTLQLFTTRRFGLFIPGREECVTCPDAEALLTEVADLSPQLRLSKHDLNAEAEAAAAVGVDKVPALVLRGTDGVPAGQVRFFGLPSGYEFLTLVDDIIAVSRGTAPLSATTQERLQEALAGTDERLHLQVFVTPT
ncbi:MAG: hypothetical protein CL878_12380 [Dehalococcoidia bacterium]|nr:hypothetical protein [Dehalococcoidia bacterium]